ncbi:MAG TPA: hypothetical protein VGB43_06630 [Flavobacterium sp.]|jgi:hypothetical protein
MKNIDNTLPTLVIIHENEKFNGINIWEYPWKDMGEQICANDPNYPERHKLDVYTIKTQSGLMKFATSEIAPGVYGTVLIQFTEDTA